MSQYKVQRINYISSGKKQKLINLDLELKNDSSKVFRNITFLTNSEEQDNIFNPYGQYNKASFRDNTNSRLIHNLYDIKDICLKSDIKKDDDGSGELNSSDNYVNIYAPQLDNDPIEFAQIKDFTYILSHGTTKGPNVQRTDLYEERNDDPEKISDAEYHQLISSDNINTYLYDEPSHSELSDNYKVRTVLDNIQYNYIFEVPQNPTDYNDFDSGDVQAELFNTKNIYDSSYTMNMSNSNTLNNCRDYCGIGVCANTLYLKYYDNIKYTNSSTSTDDDGIVHKNMISSYMDTLSSYPFQKIETVKSINRFKSNTRHKSNLYSIELNNTGLNFQSSDKTLMNKIQKIKNDIRNNIREITKNVCPVETQLFDIYFRGD